MKLTTTKWKRFVRTHSSWNYYTQAKNRNSFTQLPASLSALNDRQVKLYIFCFTAFVQTLCCFVCLFACYPPSPSHNHSTLPFRFNDSIHPPSTFATLLCFLLYLFLLVSSFLPFWHVCLIYLLLAHKRTK